jgi:hypothetical protein
MKVAINGFGRLGRLALQAIVSQGLLGKDKVENGFFGQEINITTYNLCRINIFFTTLTTKSLISLTEIRLPILFTGTINRLKQ